MRAKAAIYGIGLVLPAPEPVELAGLDASRGAPGYVVDTKTLTDFIPSGALRRVGRSQLMALNAAARAMAESAEAADAIDLPSETSVFVGTGLGSVGETVAFLENMFELDEAQPKPVSFINSVHNSTAGSLALAYGLRGENRTFVHESISFEQALNQAVFSIEEARCPRALVCGVEEMSRYVVSVGAEYGWWSDSCDVLRPMSGEGGGGQGTLPGEGAAVLVLGAASSHVPVVQGVSTMPLEYASYARIDGPSEAEAVRAMLSRWGVPPESVDLVMIGASGATAVDEAYARLLDALFPKETSRRAVSTYKERCGEFCTAASVGTAMAAREIALGRCECALILHLSQGKYLSVIVVSR